MEDITAAAGRKRSDSHEASDEVESKQQYQSDNSYEQHQQSKLTSEMNWVHLNLGTCKKHRRRFTMVCRNLCDRCGCQGRLFCIRCVSKALSEPETSHHSSDSSTHASTRDSLLHEFEDIHEFLSKTVQHVLIDSTNFSAIADSLKSRICESSHRPLSQSLLNRLSKDVFFAMQHNHIDGSTKTLSSTTLLLSQIHSDKIYEKYSNQITSSIEHPLGVDTSTTPSSCSTQLQSSKRWKQETFEGVDRKFAKYFRIGSRSLYVLNQVTWELDCFDLGLGVQLPAACVPLPMHFQKKSQILALNSRLIAVLSNPKTLYIMNIDRPSEYHRYRFQNLVLKVSVIKQPAQNQNQSSYSSANLFNYIVLQQSTKLLLYKYSLTSFRCVRVFHTPLLVFFKPTVILGCLQANEILFATWFSIVRLNIINGEISQVVISKEYMQRRPDYADQVEFDAADVLAFRETEKLRKTIIEFVKRISNDAILVVYQDWIEIRSIRDNFQLLETYSLACDSVALDTSMIPSFRQDSTDHRSGEDNTIYLLTKKKEKSIVYAMHPSNYSIQEVLQVNEIYTKLLVCDKKFYLFKHTYFEVSTKYPGLHSLVLHVYK